MASQIKSRGFTIVELLIVIVIIAILAAITIVAYNGITARAHSAAAQQAAQIISNKAEAYNAERGNYPATLASMTSAASTTSYYIPTGSVTLVGAAITAAPAKDNTVAIQKCLLGAAIIGFKISYWDFAKSASASITAGAATSCTTYITS